MVKDGYYECDYCHKDRGFAQFYTETGNHVECQDRDSTRSELQEVLDLLKTECWVSAKNRLESLIAKMETDVT